jgi:hypothetical protein
MGKEYWYYVFLLLTCWKLKPVFCQFWHCSFASTSPRVILPQGNTQQSRPKPTVAVLHCKMVCWLSSSLIYAEPAKLILSRSATTNMNNQIFWCEKCTLLQCFACETANTFSWNFVWPDQIVSLVQPKLVYLLIHSLKWTPAVLNLPLCSLLIQVTY